MCATIGSYATIDHKHIQLQAQSNPVAAPGLFAELLARPPAKRSRLAGALAPEASQPEGGQMWAGRAVPARQPARVRSAYASPLLAFRSYRCAGYCLMLMICRDL